MRSILLLTVALLLSCATTQRSSESRLSSAEFILLLERLADAWNSGNARDAADCFTADAIYVEPWRRVVFDPATQLGMAEFSFSYGSQVHGVAVINAHSGRISQWREYWYESAQPFEQFVAPSKP